MHAAAAGLNPINGLSPLLDLDAWRVRQERLRRCMSKRSLDVGELSILDLGPGVRCREIDEEVRQAGREQLPRH